MKKEKARGILSGTKVLVGSSDLKSWLKEHDFGEEQGARRELSLLEALFLVEEKKMEIRRGSKVITSEELITLGSKNEKNFYAQFAVFRDLRSRGLLVRTGFKFGADFRVYERGKKIKDHSTYLVHVVPEEHQCSFPELARAVRLSSTVNKTMAFAIVDEEGDISYYAVDRVKL